MEEDGWDKFYRTALEEAGRLASEMLDRFRVSLGDWLYANLNWPTPDWRQQLALFVEHTRYYGLVIEPECVQTIHDLIEARVDGTGPFAILGPYGAAKQGPATDVPIKLSVNVAVDDSTGMDPSATTEAPVEGAEAESSAPDQPFVISVIPDVSGPEPKPAAANTNTPPDVATKPHLPADSRGTWIIGEKGDGVFQYNNSAVNQRAGIAGAKIRFKGQYIAEGGFPADAYYGGSAAEATVAIERVTGTGADNVVADAAMRKKLGNPAWRRPQGYRWNHAGGPQSKTMELVDADFHEAVAHKGSAAGPRAARRAAKARGLKGTGGKGKGSMGKGAVGRAMAVVAVYLTLREALQAAGILEPDYYVFEGATYFFVANDGSVFIVWSSGWFWSPKREFVAGPRKGQKEKLTKAEFREYQRIAEDEWGKYIPGTIFREPRFIPGRQRKTLPLIDLDYGDVGWIDEAGVHRIPGIPER